MLWQMNQKDQVTQAWTSYHKNEAGREPSTAIPSLSAMRVFQRVMIEECSKEIERRAKEKLVVRLWSAGSGIDIISLMLSEAFPGRLSATVFDISPECISRNKEMFSSKRVGAEFVVGDLFDATYTERFDIVINTGLLEHFDRQAQETLLSIFSKSLVKGGVYITATPFSGARLYEYCKKRAIAKGSWPYGPENAVGTLSELKHEGLTLRSERQIGATDQLVMLKHAFPRAKGILGYGAELAESVSFVTDPVLRPFIGGYAILDEFVKS